MEIMTRLTDKEFSQKKLEEYANWEKIVQYGRRNPLWFLSWGLGAELMDFQKWIFMNCWYRPFCLLLCCRGAGKTVEASLLHMCKMLLIPSWKQYVASNSLAQSIECFKKIESIALNRIPSFKSLTDIFAEEVYRTPNSETGFIHDPKGHTFKLFNDSELITLSSNLTANRGRRGAVHFDECAWLSEEAYAVLENFINVDTSFRLGVDNGNQHIDPKQIPLQLLYTSSASDCESHYFKIFKEYSMKQLMGDPNYFVADLTADAIIRYSSVNGVPIKSHLTQAQIDKAVEDNPELAERELYNHFRKGSGANSVVKLETLMHNSESRLPLLYNDTGKKKFIFCYDPARSFDNSALSIFQLIEDKEIGYYLRLENVITMVDTESRNKTPLSMNEQIKIIQREMIKYNGERAAEWENIQFYIDAGAGGQALSVCDQLLDDWEDDKGIKHRGIIDPVHKQYETARKKYPLAMPIVHLIDPQGYKKIIYTALQEMCMLNLIKFTEYDGKDELSFINADGEIETHELNKDEKLALTNIELAKNELSYMCRYETPNGGVQFELEREKRNKMHDDRAYTMALGGYALSTLRRHDLITPVINNDTVNFFLSRPAKTYK